MPDVKEDKRIDLSQLRGYAANWIRNYVEIEATKDRIRGFEKRIELLEGDGKVLGQNIIDMLKPKDNRMLTVKVDDETWFMLVTERKVTTQKALVL